MKTLEIKLNREVLTLGENEANKTDIEFFAIVVENVVLAYGQQQRGFDEKERRQFYKILDTFETAKKAGSNTIQLEDDWVGFIKKCFRETKLMPNKLLEQIEGIINPTV
jgi:hypothetical protein